MKNAKTLYASAEHVTLFGRFSLARESRMLSTDGKALTLSERAMDVLIALLDAGGKIVSIDQFQQRLSPASSIVANSVQALVSQLRSVLGDDRDMIETVPRRGYRFAAGRYDIRDELTTPDSKNSVFMPEARALPDMLPAVGHNGKTDSALNCGAACEPLIGRDAELSELLMRVPQHRLVTLTSARGNGKTRLAREAALRTTTLFHDGVTYIELAELTLPDLVPDVIAAHLAPPSQQAVLGLDGLIAQLAGRRTLLIIDDCDHLAHEVATVVEALLAATDVCVIVCSEAPLFTAGEYVFPLAPLRFAPRPLTNASPDARDASPSDACRFFVAQLEACGALFGYEADGSASRNTAAIPTSVVWSASTQIGLESICRALSGNPLALELAARQIACSLHSRTTLAQAVADWDVRWRRLMLQRAGSREVTLQPAALVSSVVVNAYCTLDTNVQHVLCCVSLFAGPFDIADTYAVSDQDDESEMRAVISILINAGLLLESPTSGLVRMLQVPQAVRRFTLDVLALRSDYVSIAGRHAQWVAERISEADSHSGECVGAAGGLHNYPASRLADVRRAVGWSIEAGRFQIAAQLLRQSGPIWAAARLTNEWLTWTRRMLNRDLPRPVLKVRDQMLLYLALAQAMHHAMPPWPPAEMIAAWWRVYELATACADDDSRLHALSVLLLRTLEAGFNDDSPGLLMQVRARIAQECDCSSSHRGFALLRGALLTLDGRHDAAIGLLAPLDESTTVSDSNLTEANPPDTHYPDYVAVVSVNAYAISLWLTGAHAISHPTLLRALQDARQHADPVSRCTATMMACVLFLLEDNAPRVARQARWLIEIAQHNGLQGWRNIGHHFLQWTRAVEGARDEARKLTQLALRNLARGHATIIDLAVLDRFAGQALNEVGYPVLNRHFEQVIENILDSGRAWLLPEALRVSAVLCHHACLPTEDVRALLERAAHEAHHQRASLLSRRISATMEKIAPSREGSCG